MIRKKIDDKIKILLNNCIKLNERSMFLIIGDKSRDQISNLHSFYNKLNPGKKLNILWCYKKELGFSNHAKKKMKKIKKLMNKGVYTPNDENSFDLFLSSSDIKFCYYHDTQRILGKTFGMLILQDFEAITPNLLCRTIETVTGGGIIIFLLNNMTSLKQLYTISMDVHDRYRTGNYKEIQPRFNERFILSLSNCRNCLTIDDELNVLPITNSMKNIKEINNNDNIDENNNEDEIDLIISKQEKELSNLKKSFENNKNPISKLINICKTLDQAKTIMLLVDTISEKNSKITVSITSGRGRGKSASMGLAVSCAIVYGYSNLIVTAPSPENLSTFFEFFIIGLNSLGYIEHKDYIITEGVNEFKGVITNVTIIKNHKQTLRYILPSDILIFQMAELVIIDEAAAIPLSIVKKIMPDDCLTFMASTVQGYEGTGRSLSLKLIDGLRNKNLNSRNLKEISLNQAIRYSDKDAIEKWLNELLLLDCNKAEEFEEGLLLEPGKLELYLVNRDTLFSYHKSTEKFLKKIMSLFVSSHYKNSPNDIQLLSDAPAHKIFVLCKKIEKNDNKNENNKKGLPDIYCAIQVCEEGGISKDVILNNDKRGFKPSGDLIPWTLGDYYQDKEFGKLLGVRIVRIACHPDYTKMGYGSRALQLLSEYYEGKFVNLNENDDDDNNDSNDNNKKKKIKPLLSKLEDTKPNFVYYLGTSFGLTNDLYNFWSKNKYKILYLALGTNDITGEHSCIMIKPLREGNIKTLVDINEIKNNEDTNNINWIKSFIIDFKHRFSSLLSFEFKNISIKLALSILEPKLTTTTASSSIDINDNNYIKHNNIIFSKKEIELFISKYDFQRLELYSKNMVNYSIILDLIPTLSKLYFTNKIQINLSYIQAGVLLGIGLQKKTFDIIKEEFNIENNQLLAMFNKMIKKFVNYIREIYEKNFEKEENEEIKKNEIKLNINNKENEENILKEMKDELKEETIKIKEKSREEKKKYMEEKFKNMKKKEEEYIEKNKNLNKKRKRNKQ